ncbi:MAG: hypothetical protein ABSF12_09550 [Bryobacteraceae bacterium]|jgi:hypothetical protein
MNDLVAIEKIAQWEKLKKLVLDSVSSPITKRVYNMALNEFMAWFSRARLSDIEREYVTATPEDLGRIEAAIDGIIETRRHLAELAEQAGLSLTGVRL